MRRNAHKYNAKRTELDGYQFASKAEAKRYAELKLLEKAGEIRNLRLQSRFPLYVRSIQVADYVADFVYQKSQDATIPLEWADVVEDVKGVRTAVYRLKKRMVEAQYGITISEITR